MQRSSFASGSLCLSGGRERIRGSSIQAGGVHGGAGGSGVRIFHSSQPLLVGAYRGGLGGGFSSGLGLGSGLGVGFGSGIGASSAAVGGGIGGAWFGGNAAFKGGSGFGGAGGGAGILILNNEKFTMRVLNERLASYLKKVHLLETANAELELKIGHFVDSRTPTERDYSDSLSTINELHDNILDAIQFRGAVHHILSNVTLAADDFRIKYENELGMRQTFEADIAGLKRLLDDIYLSIKELTVQIDTLNEEKVYLKKIYQEEMVATRSQMSGQINVEVDAAPQQDLTSVLEDIRYYYETVALKNRKELEGWFKGKLETLKKDPAISTETIGTSQTEMNTEKITVQGLDLQLQSMLAVKASLEEKLSETQNFYAAQLSGYQLQVTSLEEQLLQLRADLEHQGRDYQMLLDIKTRLELEIAEYRRLLDVGASGSALVMSGQLHQRTPFPKTLHGLGTQTWRAHTTLPRIHYR
ncbi:keratin, type I cytoskeletal 13 [Ictalurus furcatus]|uniref:keratin, type I cytoskeletal 13 n=1 Tax=Ictalurus furcatus TaxID=66913 RepID=UPI002350DFFB|nr:keratin, type I cytoskeletal 13 [Ictalurus furcatus]